MYLLNIGEKNLNLRVSTFILFMKILFLLLVLFSNQLISQTTEESILEIRKMYKETENVLNICEIINSNDWIDEEQYNGYTPEITAYYDTRRKEIVKIVEYGAGDWHESTTSYYLREGKLFFVFIESYSPEEMFTGEELGMTEEELHESGGEAKTLDYYEGRIYIKDWVVIRDLTKHKIMSASEGDPSLKEIKNEQEEIFPGNYEGVFSHLEKMLEHLKTKN